ncbi:hypothetical protein JCGZ_07138 [Jatropha curcas]|uniref:Uncharacterized protein n=1 Tax=Jatropha curcas TaxID=180498 RepID=A0A067KBP3_JATCU|nr:hypothetical protein JCGZ_07138 [Jatropha curcas]
MDQTQVKDDRSLLYMLEALRKASKDLQNNSIFITHNPQTIMESLLNLRNEADALFSTNPNLSKLCNLLFTLKTLHQKIKTSQGYSLKSLLSRQITNYKIYQVGYAIEAEVQACIDKECVRNLVRIIQETESDSEEDKLRVLKGFEKRLSQGFDGDFQELVLRAKGFSLLESLICDSTRPMKIREQAALCVVGLVRFNRDVFVGLVLMGPIVQSLVSTASDWSIQVLCSLIRLIRTPLIDEIELEGEIPRIISLFSSQDLSIQVAAMDCVYEIAYFGRKEVIEAMIEQGLIEKLMELQRSTCGDDLAERDQFNGNVSNAEVCAEIVKKRPFASCVARFALQVEVGEGLERKERKELKREILRRVREASVSEAEAASVVAEVLWGSYP